MLSDSEINGLVSQLNQLKKDASQLKSELSALNRKKEEAYARRHQVSIQIRKDIGNIRQDRSQRDSLTTEVKMSKQQREQANNRIRELLGQLKKVNEERQAAFLKLGLKEDPGQMRRDMKHLEHMIETGAVSFDKEKKMMVMIKKIKKQLDSFKTLNVHDEKAHAIKKELDGLRRNSESAHKQVQTTAQKSQKIHEEMLGSSKHIDELRKEENELTKQYEEMKQKMREAGAKLDEKAAEIDKIIATLGENNVHTKEEKHRTEHEILRKKDEAVQEKLRKRQKITTEDLLVLQRTMMKERR